MNTPAPTVMRMVLFVMPSGAIRPACIHDVHGPTCVSLSVFTGANDTLNGRPLEAVTRQTSVMHDQDGKKPGTWHWNEHQVATGKPSH